MRDANAAACVLKREQDVTTSERQRRRPRRPRWQFTWTHQRCDRWQLAYHALSQHAQPLGAAQRVLSAPHELTWPLFPYKRFAPMSQNRVVALRPTSQPERRAQAQGASGEVPQKRDIRCHDFDASAG